MTNAIALTTVNAVLLSGWFIALRYSNIRWRVMLAMLPTPMLGFASSYGVFAYNAHFAPAWIAFFMAAAYEITYVGIASYTTINVRQRAEGEKISRDAAWISFIQNGLAGLVFIQPSVMGYNAWGWKSLFINVPLAALHAAQVWIAYRASRFTMHGVQTKETEPQSPVQPTLEAPNEDNLIHKDAAMWSQMNEQGMSFQAIADEVGKSKGWVHKQVRNFRDNVG